MFGAIVLALLFLLKLNSRRRGLHENLKLRYGSPTINIFRKLDNVNYKIGKVKEDIFFLNTCKTYNVTPNFLKFKVYSKNFNNTRTYRTWQAKLLQYEIDEQGKRLSALTQEFSALRLDFQSKVSFFDFRALLTISDNNVQKKIARVKLTHIKKLKYLGIDVSNKIDPNKVIFNLSDRVLSNDEKEVLSLGLDFGLIPKKVNFVRYQLAFEKLCFVLKDLPKYGNKSFSFICNQISNLAYNSLKRVKLHFRLNSELNDHRIYTIKNLRKDENLVFSRPDKGRGVVIMNRADYIEKINYILSDSSKFMKIKADIATHILKLEDKLNRVLRSLKQKIGDLTYNKLFASGSKPGYLYGLPKIHKADVPLRPIISSIGTFNYNLSKFLVPILQPLMKNNFSVVNSLSFVKELCSFDFGPNVTLASFDVTSLFTNIPLRETSDLILENTDDEYLSSFGLNKSNFSKLLDLATIHNAFTFNDVLYSQTDGVAMGSPLGPVYADIFMNFNEKKWISDCPSSFKPLLYRRYVDDTFLVFRCPSHINLFLDYLNSKHPNIKFTCEMEHNSKLSFLDIEITNANGKFTTSVYRKPTFTGLGLSFLSFTPFLYKVNSIKTLVNRAFNVCSDYLFFDTEVKFLKNFFTMNGYPMSVFYRVLNKFLNDKFNPVTEMATVSKQVIYLKFPFLGDLSNSVKRSLLNILNSNYPQVNFRFVFTNTFNVGTLLKEKNSLSFDLCSGLVYLFTCAHCSMRYIGSTNRWFRIRYSEHRGLSYRTNFPLTNPPFSAIREHSLKSDHPFTHQDFTKLFSSSCKTDLVISESIFIRTMKPRLNNTESAAPLSLMYF